MFSILQKEIMTTNGDNQKTM